MKLKNLNKPITSESLNNSLKEKFGYRLNLDNLGLDRAQKMLVSINEGLNKVLKASGEKARTSKLYTEKKLISETLTHFVQEKRKAIQLEQRRSLLKRRLVEAEEQEAEVLLASKDIVDRIQKMVEDLGAIQNEQLLPLVDSIRRALGDETASSYEGAMSSAITSAMDAMRTARTDADSATRILSGGEVPDPTMGGDTDDLDVPEEPVSPDIGAGPRDGLGREKRKDIDLDLSGL